MSTTLFAIGTSSALGKSKPSTSKSASLLNSLAALVPAEVLVAQVAILQVTTTTTPVHGGKATTTISDPGALALSFWALLGLSAVFYLAARWTSQQKLRWLDLAGVVIAPLAFLGWSLLQSPSAFSAAFPAATEDGRSVAGYLLAALLVVAAPVFSYKAGQAKSKEKKATQGR